MEIGVILCTCKGKISKIDELKTYFDAGVEKALCEKPYRIKEFVEKNNLEFLVIGACGEENYKSLFSKILLRSDRNPLSLKVVNLKDHCSPVSENVTKKAQLMILSSISGAKEFEDAPPESLKFFLPKDLTRRDFLLYFSRRHLKAIPYIEKNLCKSSEGCRMCIPNCSLGSISFNGELLIKKSRCEGCGICVKACPLRAIRYPTYSYEVLTSQVSGLLSKKVELSPRIITFFCEKLNTLKGISYPSNFLEVPLPCLGMLNSYMILKSFTLGAQGVALVPCECRYSLESNFSSELAFSRRILENFGIEAERVRIFEPKESFSRELEGFCHEIENMKQPISHVTPEEREEEPELSNLLKTMKGNYAFKKQKLFGEEVPFGLLSLDEKMCTLCDVCVRNCYSDALEIVRGKDTLRLFFNHSRCNGCERCIDFCHERALSMKKGLDLALLEEKKLLMEDKEERCKICGSFLGSSNLLQKISERASEEKKEPEYIKLCYTCRIKASLIP